MRTLATAVSATFILLLINGCTAQKMMEPMDSEMSSMDKPVEKSMKDETMMEDTATESMKPTTDAMDKVTQ